MENDGLAIINDVYNATRVNWTNTFKKNVMTPPHLNFLNSLNKYIWCVVCVCAKKKKEGEKTLSIILLFMACSLSISWRDIHAFILHWLNRRRMACLCARVSSRRASSMPRRRAFVTLINASAYNRHVCNAFGGVCRKRNSSAKRKEVRGK